MSAERTFQQKAALRLKAARVELSFDARLEFYAGLAYHLRDETRDGMATAGTDGTSLVYDPKWIMDLPSDRVVGLLAHEVEHFARGHNWRMVSERHTDPIGVNAAMDYEINADLVAANVRLPEGGLHDAKYIGWPCEKIYDDMPRLSGGGKAPGNGNKPQGWGEVLDPTEPGNGGRTAEDWNIIVQEVASRCDPGKLPGSIRRLLGIMDQPPCRDLVSAILEWASRACRDDYSWRRPNRRFVQQGIYLPSLYSVQVPPIVAVVDTSGSICERVLNLYVAALRRVLTEILPEKLVVISCDASVHRVAEYAPGETIDGEFPGGGGTDFRPAFQEAENHAPCGLVYLTDLAGTFPADAPDYPVLWVSPETYDRAEVPFGDVIYTL